MALHDIYSGREIDRASRPDRAAEREDAAGRWARDAGGGYAGERAPGVAAILWRRRGLVLASVLLCCALGATYIALTPPRYTATAAMLIDPGLGKSGGNDPDAPGFAADAAAMDSQIKLITSQTVLARVAAQAGLAADPEFNGRDRSLLQRLLHPGLVLDGGIDLRALEDAIAVKRPAGIDVVEIGVAARDPKVAAAIANGLTAAYIADQVSSRRTATREDTGDVAGRLDALTKEIKALDQRIEDAKAKNRTIEAAGLRHDEQQVADLTTSLGEARAKTAVAKAKYDEAAALAKTGRIGGVGDALKSPTIERLRQQQAQTDEDSARLAQTLGDRHPVMREAIERQAKVRALVAAELDRLKTALLGDWKAAQVNETRTQASLERSKAQAGQLSRSLVPLDPLERDRAALRATFDRLAQVKGSLPQQDAAPPPGRIIAVARPPVSPSSPRKSVVGLAALSSGLFLGVVGALFAESTSPSPAAPPPADEVPHALPRRRYWPDDEL